MGLEGMKRIRAVGIVVKGDDVLLMHRRNIKEYFVFPGGGVEEGETIEQAVLRELKEETTLDVGIKKLLYRHVYDDGSEQYFFLCDYISGEPKLADDSVESKKMLGGNEYYRPVWVKIAMMKGLLVYPLEIRDSVMNDAEQGFAGPMKASTIKIAELRQDP